jgi:uncharacterized protein
MTPPSPAPRSLLRTESFGSASVTWLNRTAAREAASTAACELAERFPEVAGVLLFGSLARGDAVPSSDVDLIVLLRQSDLPFLDRIPRYSPVVGELAVDVLPYTLAEWTAMQADEHPLVRAALREGEWLVGP